MTRQKVLLLGWDSADWKTIHPLVDQGLMPNMQKLIEGGTIGNLATLDPMYSPMLWSSIATGKRPYKHGVLGFTEVTPDGTNIRPVMSVSRKCKAIWNILTQNNIKNHVVGWWPSHPAEHINGTMISNFYQKAVGKIHEPWPLASGTVHPESESDFFATLRVHPGEITGEHILPFVPQAGKINQFKDKRLAGIAKITSDASSLHAAFTNIIRTKEWDFAALYLDAIDHYCHGFMKYNPPKRSHISQEDYDVYNNVVTAGYRFHDMMLGRIMELIDDQTILMLISDHGFQPGHLRPRNIPNEPAGPAYEHSRYGIFAAMGPGIKKDSFTFGASLLDITPTILQIMGLAIGEDMDGRVLNNIFEKTQAPNYIPSWENIEGETGMISESHISVKENTGEEALKQLEDLGYIEKQTSDLPTRIKQTRNECQFNLARAYIDGGLISDAVPILEELSLADPQAARYTFRLASCYQALGRLKDAREMIQLLRDGEHYSPATLDVMEGGLLLGERQPLQAIKMYKRAEKNVDKHLAKINLQIAQAYILLKRWDDALVSINKELKIDNENPDAHFTKGEILLRQQNYEDASNSFLTAIGLDFHQPTYHHFLGESLYHFGEYNAATKAFESSIAIFPDNNKAKQRLIHLYRSHLNREADAAKLEAEIDTSLKGTIYVVSGLPRSGTSLMMQMLEKGGMDIFTDQVRESDENNPKGYYEHEAVKNLAKNKKWVPDAKDKVVKVVAQLLHHLPPHYHYKIVFMERDLYEIIASQQKMLERLGKKEKSEIFPTEMLNNFEKTIDNVKKWLTLSQNVDIIFVKHKAIITDPFSIAIQLNEFLDYQLIPELMVSAVDTSLHREKK